MRRWTTMLVLLGVLGGGRVAGGQLSLPGPGGPPPHLTESLQRLADGVSKAEHHLRACQQRKDVDCQPLVGVYQSQKTTLVTLCHQFHIPAGHHGCP